MLADIRAAQAGGTQEVVLTGVNIQAWGQDIADGLHLADLLAAVLNETDIPRLRLSSLEPWELKEGFFNVWQDSRMCQHLHLPLQSGSAGTLKRMVRKTTPENFRSLVKGVRTVCPQMAITTDIITGFPGETKEEFAETVAFVREMNFAAGHVFTFSARPGTAAARMKDQVPVKVRKERNAVLRAVLEESAQNYRQQFLGQVVSVLWESAQEQDEGWMMTGLTGQYLRVEAFSPVKVWNQIQDVRLLEDGEKRMVGEIVGG